MKYIYVGRLDKEKGIETLIAMIYHFDQQKTSNIHFHIFGKGAYDKIISQLAKEKKELLTYYGRKNKKDIKKLWQMMDFFLMPSTFLETFGLTACESLILGVPVIGHKKGGLECFIHEDLDIERYKGTTDSEKMITLIDHLSQTSRQKSYFDPYIKDIQKSYTTSKRKDTIKNVITGNNHTIYMISDFINYNGGGVETHIHDIGSILSEYNIYIYGHQAPQGIYARIKKLIYMIMSLCNIKDSILLLKKIKKQHAGLIRWHSISRVIGWLPIAIIARYTQKKAYQHIMTHHELGLFHPFPSRVTDTTQLPKAWSLYGFIKAGKTNNIIIILLIISKYFLIRLIHKQLQKTIKTHIVPSEWMKPLVSSRYPNTDIVVIPHFVTTV